jgi:hypothetical protein
MHAIILRCGAGLSDRCSPPRCKTRVVTQLSHQSVVPCPPELGECRFVCETVRKVAVQWPARGGRLGCQQIESSRKCSYRLFHSSNVSSSNKRNNAAETSITKLAISICDAYLYSDL